MRLAGAFLTTGNKLFAYMIFYRVKAKTAAPIAITPPIATGTIGKLEGAWEAEIVAELLSGHPGGW